MPNLSENRQEINGGGGRWSGNSNAGRVIRRRDQQQPRMRMQRHAATNQRDNNNLSSARSFAQKRPWKFSDPSLESTPHQKNSFLSLLPPPPPRAASKILAKDCHPSNMSPAPAVKVVGMKRDDEDNEWIDKISEAIKKEPTDSNMIGSSSSSIVDGRGEKEAVYRARSVEFQMAAPPLTKLPIGIPASCHSQMGHERLYGGGQRFAPAVQIRSVIPVCASPPVRPRSKEAAASSSSSITTAELGRSLGKMKL